MDKIKGLALAAQIYANRDQRARELKAAGKKIAGYFCCYPPVELMTAAGYLPIRILGDMDETITAADNYLPTVMCLFYRSCLDLALKGRYDYLDTFVGAHACDGAERVSYIWRSYIKSPCSFYLDVPHTNHDAALEFFKTQLKYFTSVLEEGSGIKATPEKIAAATALYNQQKALVRNLYELRKGDPPLITGTEFLQVMVAVLHVPVEEGNELLRDIIAEVQERELKPAKKKGRILIWGSLFDHTAITKLIEECDLNIVMDDTAVGSRSFWIDTEPTADPFDGIADRYLNKVVCPRTFKDTKPSRQEELDSRFGYLKKMIKEWQVNGVYMNIIRNCDIHGYEIPELRDYLEEAGIPVLVIEQDYSTASLAPLRTRFQAFAESID
jgi:bcr-type benzoyl-CoA reductase subunit C